MPEVSPTLPFIPGRAQPKRLSLDQFSRNTHQRGHSGVQCAVFRSCLGAKPQQCLKRYIHSGLDASACRVCAARYRLRTLKGWQPSGGRNSAQRKLISVGGSLLVGDTVTSAADRPRRDRPIYASIEAMKATRQSRMNKIWVRFSTLIASRDVRVACFIIYFLCACVRDDIFQCSWRPAARTRHAPPFCPYGNCCSDELPRAVCPKIVRMCVEWVQLITIETNANVRRSV